MSRRPFLLAYDISDRRRLARMHRLLLKWGTAVQYSVFRVMLDQDDQKQLMAQVERIAAPKVDDVRLYRLPGGDAGTNLGGKWSGKAAMGGGIHLIDVVGRPGEFDAESEPSDVAVADDAKAIPVRIVPF